MKNTRIKATQAVAAALSLCAYMDAHADACSDCKSSTSSDLSQYANTPYCVVDSSVPAQGMNATYYNSTNSQACASSSVFVNAMLNTCSINFGDGCITSVSQSGSSCWTDATGTTYGTEALSYKCGKPLVNPVVYYDPSAYDAAQIVNSTAKQSAVCQKNGWNGVLKLVSAYSTPPGVTITLQCK